MHFRKNRGASIVDVVLTIILNELRETTFDSAVGAFLKQWVGNVFKKMERVLSE